MAPLSDLPVEIMQKIIQEIPSSHLKTLSNLSLTCRSIAHYVLPFLYKTFRIRLAGYESAGHYIKALLNLAKSENPFQPSRYVKEIVIDGYWKFNKELDGEEYQIIHALSTDHLEDSPGGFDKALHLFMQSLLNLESFTWKIVHTLPQPILEEISKIPNFKSFSAYCDPHIVSTIEGEREFVVGLDPTSLVSCSLETLHMLELSDLQQCIQFGDVLRSSGTWERLRNLKITLSTWYSCKQVDIEPNDHDLLSIIFRPYPASHNKKLKLTHLALSDLQCHARGARALDSCIDPSTLEDLYFYFIHDASVIFNTWTPSSTSNTETMEMPNLKRLYIREEREFPYLEAFISQFVDPKHKGGKGLEWLELHSWHIEIPFGGGIGWGGYHSNQGTDVPFNTFSALAGERKTIGDSQIVDERNSWGLKKMHLDLRRNGPFGGPKIVENIKEFLAPFWRLEILALPVSYDKDMWANFVQTVSALPELRYPYLLNFRNEKETAGGYYGMPRRSIGRQPPQRAPRHWGVAAKDALEIAKANRLYNHTVLDFLGSMSLNYSADATWRGKLHYIGIRNIKRDAEREVMVWKVVLRQARPSRRIRNKPKTNEHGEFVELVKLDGMDVEETTIFYDK